MAGEETLKLGSYILLLELATGGMATVYIAKQAGAAGFERLVIIKRVHRHLLRMREFYDMFCDEARVASLIRHPNVVSVDDVVQSDEELFLVQPYVESVSLARLIEAARQKGEQLPPAVAVRIVADAVGGLAAAHDAVDMRGARLDVVHRDVSPHNVLVGSDGRSRLIDFGIAKAARRITTTGGGIMKGKLAYMSPEQARQNPVDARADLFAMGAVLHESLVGKQLFRGEDEADVLLAVLIGDIPVPSTLAKDVPPELDAVVKKALEREAVDRFQTGADFLESLEKAVPPAQGREVAQLVERLCGAELETRREAIRKSLDEPPNAAEIPRLTPLPFNKDDETWSGVSSQRPSSSQKSDVTMAATPGLKSSRPPPPGSTPPPAKSRAAVIAGVALLVGFAGVASAVRFASWGDKPGTGTATEPAASGTMVTVTMTAELPIESVTAEGLHTVALEGNVARISVARWSGSITVRAALKGGGTASAVVDAAGPYDVKLVAPSPSPGAASASGSASAAPLDAAPSASASSKPVKPTKGGRPPGVKSNPTKNPGTGLKPNPF